jgi:hypothetical protein
MSCPGLHCPGCPGGGLALGPILGAGAGIYLADCVLHDPTFLAAFRLVLVCMLIGECLAVVGLVVGLVLVIRADRPVRRYQPPAVIRAQAESIGPEPVYTVTTATERGALEPGRTMTAGELAGAPEPARARVIRGRRGAGVGPGR